MQSSAALYLSLAVNSSAAREGCVTNTHLAAGGLVGDARGPVHDLAHVRHAARGRVHTAVHLALVDASLQQYDVKGVRHCVGLSRERYWYVRTYTL